MRSFPARAETVLAALLFVTEARAEAPVIEVDVPPVCSASAAGLAARLTRLAAGSEGSHAEVKIEPSGAGYRVTLRTSQRPGSASEKTVLAPSCDEAVEVASVVLALAFTVDARKEAPPRTGPDPVSATLSEPRARVEGRPEPSSSTHVEPRGRSERWPDHVPDSSAESRVFVATGVDAGTLPVPTLFVAAGFGRSFSALELRGALRYGLPVTEEDEDSGVSEAWRSDFGALDLRTCYGFGSAFRLSACAGGELGVVGSTRRTIEADGSKREEDAVSPRLSGVLAAVLAHRGGAIQPELEVSGSGVGLGRDPSAPWLVLRASAGAVVAF